MIIFSKILKHLVLLKYRFLLLNSTLIKSQRKTPLQIPIIIVNFNQLYFLKKLINFLTDRNFQKIVIIDNASDYLPLLEYYVQLPNTVTVERMAHNEGHLVFFKNDFLQDKYGRGYYVLTDADIIPNNEIPENFLETMIKLLDKYFKNITKVGLALDIDHIPEYYPLKTKVINWEQQFWQTEIEKNTYKASIDTTFALYKPNYPRQFSNVKFLRGIRMGGKFTALHGGWHIDPKNYSEENLHYIKSVNKSSSWKLDESGKHDNKGDSNYE